MLHKQCFRLIDARFIVRNVSHYSQAGSSIDFDLEARFNAELRSRIDAANRSVFIHCAHREVLEAQLCHMLKDRYEKFYPSPYQTIIEFDTKDEMHNFIDRNTMHSGHEFEIKSRVLDFREKRPKYLKLASDLEMDIIEEFEIKLVDALAHSTTLNDQIRIYSNVNHCSDAIIKSQFLVTSILQEHMGGWLFDMQFSLHGSTVNGLDKCTSDCDISLNCQKHQMSNGPFRFVQSKFANNLDLERAFMSTLNDLVKAYVPGISVQQFIKRAKVPLIDAYFVGLHFTIDICPDNMTSGHQCKLIYALTQLDERIRPLILIVQRLFIQAGLGNKNNSHFFSSWHITALVLHYLQVVKPAILPPLNQLMCCDGSNYSDSLNKISMQKLADAIIISNISQQAQMNQMQLDELLHGFFSYYAREMSQIKSFDLAHSTTVMCTSPDLAISSLSLFRPDRRNMLKAVNLSTWITFEKFAKLMAFQFDTNPLISKTTNRMTWGFKLLEKLALDFKNNPRGVLKPDFGTHNKTNFMLQKVHQTIDLASSKVTKESKSNVTHTDDTKAKKKTRK